MKTSIRWAICQRNLLESLNIDIEKCFHEAGIQPCEWNDPSSFIDVPVLHQFYESCLNAYGDPFLGVLMGEHFSLNYAGFYGLGLLSAPTYSDAIQLTLDCPNVTGLKGYYAKKIIGNEYVLTIALNDTDRSKLFEFFCNLNLASIYKAGREIADGPLPLHKVRFMHNDVKNLYLYIQYFDCDIEFGAVHNEIIQPVTRLSDIPPRCDPEIFNTMREYCQSLNRQLANEEKFTNKVERVVLTGQSQGWSIDAVAAQLHVSTRTLKRKLELEGTNFTTLVNQIRQRLAKQHLLRTHWKVDVIALQLGYSSGSNFGHAFKQWFGLTPSKYRQQLQAKNTANIQQKMPHAELFKSAI